MRTTAFITHAAPEDNDFALWLSSKLATAGYRVWVDKQRLHGGDDFWDEIDRILRNDAIKQIVVFTKNCTKPGVKRELAIGSIVAQRLSDPKFMIPIRADDVRRGDRGTSGRYFFCSIAPPQHLIVPVPPLVTITCEPHFPQM